MAKKSRRVRRKGSRPRLSEAQLVQPTAKQTFVVAEAPAKRTEPIPQATRDFGQEYRYVVSDLQRIGVLATVILGALVALSFIV